MSAALPRLLVLARLLLLALLLLPAGCVVLRDEAGVRLTAEQVAAIVPGTSTRAELLASLGPPTGVYATDLRAIVTRTGTPLGAGALPAQLDDHALTWQHVRIAANVYFFPVLFLWVDAEIESRTLTIFFEEDGRVRHFAFRDDAS
ncbi:MAG: hypothetical protein ACT4PU_11870 [Planctomycetota bacterium]